MPLHTATADRIETRIRAGEWEPGTRLPAEREFCEQLDVSRTTLRGALNDLEERGFISRHQGRGTFVTAPAPRTDLGSYFSIGAALASQGKALATSVLSLGEAEAGRQVATDLDVLPGDPVVRMDRLRSLDGDPLYLETTYLSLERFPGLLDARLEVRSLYEVLRTDYRCRVVSAVAEMLPVTLTPSEAALLGVHRNMPALSLRRVTRGEDGGAVEVSEALMRGDRARFVQHLTLEGSGRDDQHSPAMTYAPLTAVR